MSGTVPGRSVTAASHWRSARRWRSRTRTAGEDACATRSPTQVALPKNCGTYLDEPPRDRLTAASQGDWRSGRPVELELTELFEGLLGEPCCAYRFLRPRRKARDEPSRPLSSAHPRMTRRRSGVEKMDGWDRQNDSALSVERQQTRNGTYRHARMSWAVSRA